MICSIDIEVLRHQIIVRTYTFRVIWLSEMNVEDETNEQNIYFEKSETI